MAVPAREQPGVLLRPVAQAVLRDRQRIGMQISRSANVLPGLPAAGQGQHASALGEQRIEGETPERGLGEQQHGTANNSRGPDGGASVAPGVGPAKLGKPVGAPEENPVGIGGSSGREAAPGGVEASAYANVWGVVEPQPPAQASVCSALGRPLVGGGLREALAQFAGVESVDLSAMAFTSLPDSAFEGWTAMKTCVLPDTVTTLFRRVHRAADARSSGCRSADRRQGVRRLRRPD
jgi:hypothetical protein